MKKNLFGLFVVFFLIALISSCSKDDKPSPLSKDEAIAILEDSNSQMELAMGEVMETDGMKAMMVFAELNFEMDGSRSVSIGSTTRNIKGLLNAAKTPQNFNNIKVEKVDDFETPFGNYGTYTWNIAESDWNFEDSPADKVIYIFPADTENMEDNNAVLTISNFDEASIDDGMFMTSLNILLKVNDEEAMSLNYSATVSGGEVQRIQLGAVLEKFSLNFTASINKIPNGNKVVISHNIKKSSFYLTSSSLELIIEGDNIFSIDTEEFDVDIMPVSLKGHVIMGSVKFALNLNFAKYFEEIEGYGLERAANNHLSIKLYSYPEGRSLAYIKWYIVDGDLEPFLVFSDKSEVPAYYYLLYFDFEFDFREDDELR